MDADLSTKTIHRQTSGSPDKDYKTRKLLSPDELGRMKANSITRSPRRRVDVLRRSIHRMSTIIQPEIIPDPPNDAEHVTEPATDDAVMRSWYYFMKLARSGRGYRSRSDRRFPN